VFNGILVGKTGVALGAGNVLGFHEYTDYLPKLFLG
jgi:hypothetical protein